jgi:hypothetical protein
MKVFGAGGGGGGGASGENEGGDATSDGNVMTVVEVGEEDSEVEGFGGGSVCGVVDSRAVGVGAAGAVGIVAQSVDGARSACRADSGYIPGQGKQPRRDQKQSRGSPTLPYRFCCCAMSCCEAVAAVAAAVVVPKRTLASR